MPTTRALPADDLDRLLQALRRRGYECVAPTLRDDAIVYDRVEGANELPRGWTDEQAPGHYRVVRSDDDAWFGYVVGPHSWKKYLFPPEQRLWRLRRTDDGFEPEEGDREPPRRAFVGVRACEIAAIEVQDRVFSGGAHADPHYGSAREAAFVVAVSCTRSASTCFCASMGTGPAVEGGCDLALTEVLGEEHVLLLRADSERGEEVLAELELAEAGPALEETARTAVAEAARQERSLDTEGLPALLARSRESARWEEVAERCLSCANCTLACPTCFCSDVEDVSDLSGDHAERWRRWDSCFNDGFSYIHGGEVRRTIASRYRQWLTHKLGTWHDQFGTSGCVGCGRCITWCPVGIDLTEEAARLRAEDEA